MIGVARNGAVWMMCTDERFRSACASTLSRQSLPVLHVQTMNNKKLKTLTNLRKRYANKSVYCTHMAHSRFRATPIRLRDYIFFILNSAEHEI